MYEEGNKHLSFNWVSLAIKIIVGAVIIFLIGWIISLAINGSKNSKNNVTSANSEYISNITAMKETAFEYFTLSKLPQKIGGTEKLTLTQMFNQKLLIDFSDNGKKCDTDASYIQATKTADGNYALKVNLECKDKSDFIVTTIEKEDIKEIIDNSVKDNCTNCNNNTSTNNNTSNTTTNKPVNNTTKKPSNSNSTTTTKVTVTIGCTNGCCSFDCNGSNKPSTKPEQPTKTRYYQYVKWSDWKLGTSNQFDAENKYQEVSLKKYCKYSTNTYYSMGYVTDSTKKNSKYSYEIQFKNIDPDDVAYIGLWTNNYYSSSLTDYNAYINQRYEELHMTGNNYQAEANSASAYQMRDAALTKRNFTYSIESIYQIKDTYRTTININYKDHSNVDPYYDRKLGFNVYYVPLKFQVKVAYEDDCITDYSLRQWDYPNRMILNTNQKEKTWTYRIPEYKWSTEKSLSGYEYTGKYEDR